MTITLKITITITIYKKTHLISSFLISWVIGLNSKPVFTSILAFVPLGISVIILKILFPLCNGTSCQGDILSIILYKVMVMIIVKVMVMIIVKVMVMVILCIRLWL